ncbi:ribosome recycling factor [Candidatus Gottesmanbacteria bacterium]|nr:ribosome recycling factor [Candidatus Gottesmanbacteria bacterium]
MIDILINQAREKMRKAIAVTQNDLSSIRSGRATPALVEHIAIPAYGGTQRMRLMEMATITTMDAKTIVIAPYDPSQAGDIEKGILEANVGLTPVVDGEIIRISIPSLSQERRLEYLKLAKIKLEAGRVMVRQIRGDAMRDIKKLTDVSEDQQKHGERIVQELTDEMIADIDGLGEKKEAELMQV